jgi:hypothetical protein
MNQPAIDIALEDLGISNAEQLAERITSVQASLASRVSTLSHIAVTSNHEWAREYAKKELAKLGYTA